MLSFVMCQLDLVVTYQKIGLIKSIPHSTFVGFQSRDTCVLRMLDDPRGGMNVALPKAV